jgi:class 3 adenylate cyclase/tetratricopeptide (TPR) repeat protein
VIEGERKPVTVLFCDVVDSTGLAERLGPEAMHSLLNRFFEIALTEVHRYEGTVNQFLGDGFMALFGAPLAHEDHARRAVLAALGIRRACASEPIAVEGGERVSLTVRMGLHTGFVVVGAIGDNLRMDYTAVGDTTNLAARLQQVADPGAIVMSEATARLVEGDVEVESLGPVRLKGRSEPVSILKVVGRGRPRSSLERLEARTLSGFVGRARELRTLLELVAETERGRGQVVGIVGEPGVGKSRLLLELRRELAGRPVRCLEGRCLPYGSAIPYLPVLDLLRAAAGLVETDTPEEMIAKVRRALDEAGLDTVSRAPYLLGILGVKEPAGELAGLGAEALKARTFETLRQLLLRLARRHALVLAVEDVHWIDRTSEEFLEVLVESLGGAPIMLVGTSRPGYRPPWMATSFATQVSLARLSNEDSLSVVRSLLPDVAAGDSRGRVILEKAEGNPFFLEELARAVADQGLLPTGVSVPGTVHGVLMARIDRLPEEPKRLLQTASVLGREFPLALLEALWDGSKPLAPHLRELTRQEFLFEQTDAEEPAYVFKHALTQDVASATLLGPRRRELHRRAAEALAALYPLRLGDLLPVLAYHYLEAEAWDAAVEYAGRAAQAARSVYANREALERFDQALAAAERGCLPQSLRLGLHEARADVHAIVGNFEAARMDLEAALALARGASDHGAEARLLGALGMLWGGHKDYQRGLELTMEAVRLIEASGDLRALAEGRARVGVMRMNLARMREARRDLEEALRLYEALGDEGGQARTLEMLAMVNGISGNLDVATRYAESAIPRLRALGEKGSEATCIGTLGFVRAFQGDWPAAERWLRQALQLVIDTGARGHEAYARVAIATQVSVFGDYGTAWREASVGLDIAREVGHLEWTTAALGARGRVLRECGDLEEARRTHEEMLAVAGELGTALWLSEAHGELGRDLAMAGCAAEAAAHLERALEIGGDALEFTVGPLLALAELRLRRGHATEALEAVQRLYETAPEFRVFVADARRVEGEARAALGRTDEAESLLRRAKAEATAVAAAPPRWRACLALGRLLASTGRAAKAAVEYAEALEVLEQVAAGLPDVRLRESFGRTEAMREARAGIR